VSIERIDLRVDLERLAARLTTKQRVTLWLVVQGYTQAEIAEMHGVTQQAISDRLQRARALATGDTL
jgi:DNA-directed RNA polymerase specialized sigma24 family protein